MNCSSNEFSSMMYVCIFLQLVVIDDLKTIHIYTHRYIKISLSFPILTLMS